MTHDEQLLDAVSVAMAEPLVHRTGNGSLASSGHPGTEDAAPSLHPPGSPQQLMEERVFRIADQMIDLSMLALDPEQRPLVEREWRGIAQILLRAQLMLSVFRGEDVEVFRRMIVALEISQKPTSLRIVRNA